MSRDDLNCQQVRERVWEGDDGELSPVVRAEIEAHLETCSSCRKTVDITFDMIGTAREARADQWRDFDRDELYERIRGDIGAGNDAKTSMEDGSAEEGTDDDSSDLIGLSRAATLAAAVALLVVGAAVGRWSMPGSTISHGSDGPPMTRKQPGPAEGASGHRSTGDNSDLPDLHSADHPSDSLRVFASGGTQWRARRGEKRATIEVYDGTLLVELLPGADRTLDLRTPGYRLNVVGTVFYVRAGEQHREVGVLAGEVRVWNEAGERYALRAGERLEDQSVHPLDPSVVRWARRRVNLVAHEARIDSERRRVFGAVPTVWGTPATTRDRTTDLNRIARSTRADRQTDDPEGESRETTQRSRPSSASSGENDKSAASDSSPSARVTADTQQTESANPASARQRETTTKTTDDSETSTRPSSEPGSEQSGTASTESTEQADDGAKPSLETLRRRAARARHRGELERSASLLETALDRAAADGPERSDLLLQLGRLHLQHLDNPDLAGRYLREFLNKWPDAAVAPAVRAQLCRYENLATAEIDCSKTGNSGPRSKKHESH